MRRIFVLLLAAIIMLYAVPVYADADVVTFGISVYNSAEDAYVVPYCQLTCSSATTYMDTLGLLEEQGSLYADYDEQGWPYAVTPAGEENGQKLQAVGNKGFVIKVNGVLIDENNAGELVSDGSIVEWIYTDTGASSSDNFSVKNKAILWNESYATALRDAGIWLSYREQEDASYFMAMSAAGRSISSGTVVSLPSGFYEEDYTDAAFCAEALFLLSVCGYDEQTSAVADSIETLAGTEIAPDNVMLNIQILRAFDCRAYELPEGAENNREMLVRRVLQAQNSDGGFARMHGFDSDLEATVEAITVLSAYESTQVADAIRRAVSYLASWLQEDGIRPYGMLSSAQVTAKIVVAMVCAEIDPYDERFSIEGVPMADILLKWQNTDGGFMQEHDETSSPAATQDAVIALAALREGTNPYILDPIIEPNVLQTENSDGIEKEESGNTDPFFSGMEIAGILLGAGFLLLLIAFLKIRRFHRS